MAFGRPLACELNRDQKTQNKTSWLSVGCIRVKPWQLEFLIDFHISPPICLKYKSVYFSSNMLSPCKCRQTFSTAAPSQGAGDKALPLEILYYQSNHLKAYSCRWLPYLFASIRTGSRDELDAHIVFKILRWITGKYSHLSLSKTTLYTLR